MSDTRALQDDTFDLIARRVYGVDSMSSVLLAANPGLFEPIPAGTRVNTPAQTDAPLEAVSSFATNQSSQISISIDGQILASWSDVVVSRSVDSVDTISLTTPFISGDAGSRSRFKPFTFKEITVRVGSELLFTGTLVGVSPLVDSNQSTLRLSGYSKPGVLEDCTVPPSYFPKNEFRKQTLDTIAKTVAEPFGVSVSVLDAVGPSYDRPAIGSQDSIMVFLATLAKKNGLLLGSDEHGRLTILRGAEDAPPVASFNEGDAGVTTVSASFSAQEFFTHVTGLPRNLPGYRMKGFTTPTRPLVVPDNTGAFRPTSFSATDVQKGDIGETVRAWTGRMYAGAVSYQVEAASWRDPNGGLWKPNTFVKLNYPSAMIYSDYTFLVRSVSLSRDIQDERAILTLIIPESFRSEIPSRLPWDE